VDYTSQLILVGSVLMLLCVMAGQIATRLGAPVLLMFLGVGIFFGEDGPGGIVFDDKNTAYMVCSLALAVILFDGGLRTSVSSFKQAFKPALSLATVGVFITAVITGGFAVWLMDMSLVHGMLIGSIVASTDAAAVFLLLHQKGIKLKGRISATLEVESGINDPMAIFLTVTCITLLSAGADTGWMSIVGMFIKQMGLGAVIGYAGGVGLVQLLRRSRLETSLYPVVVLAGGLVIFGGSNLAGGSGFLAVYIAGITFANSGHRKLIFIRQFNDAMAWIAQVGMLLTLGLLVTPTKLVEYIVPAVLIAVFLIAVARPVAVWCSLPGAGFNWREKMFISWVGLRGGIPIYLALIPALMGVEGGQYYFNTAFIIVLSSLIVQGWTINPLARKLEINEA
jgi:cell volume regulation protein A